jgi:osmotically-inducible protein OsmY
VSESFNPYDPRSSERVKTTMDDEILRSAVIAEIDWDPSVDATHVGVSTKDGAVTLTGYVPSHAAKVAVVRAAERVKGVRAVADDIGVQLPRPGEFTDAEIAEQIARRRSWNPEFPATVEAEVADGHVTLRGEVEWSYQRELAGRAVGNLLGVRDVANEIRISPRARAIAADVERRVQGAIERIADVDARSIRVQAADGTVRLTGRVQSLAERQLAERAATSAPGVQTVENELVVDP